MLEALCGNKNVEKILLFLFVNRECYGAQLHRALKTPLPPIQKTLNRLEASRLIISRFQGQKRLYSFNPAYPLLKELHELLKKAYTLLAPDEKKNYHAAPDERSIPSLNKNSKAKILLAFWEMLLNVRHLAFHAKTNSKEEGGWNGKGRGEVLVAQTGNNCLTFNEKGSWKGKQGLDVNFSNVFRWTLDRDKQTISLEHLRYGPENPVFLFHLTPSGPHSLSSVDSHLCGKDTYSGQIHFDDHTLRLSWKVVGPKKNEELHYFYTKVPQKLGF